MPASERCERITHLVARSPLALGEKRVRWTLAALCTQTVAWLGIRSPSGMGRLLRRLRIRYKRSRSHVHSPDPDYERKRQRIDEQLQRVRQQAAAAPSLPEPSLPEPSLPPLVTPADVAHWDQTQGKQGSKKQGSKKQGSKKQGKPQSQEQEQEQESAQGSELRTAQGLLTRPLESPLPLRPVCASMRLLYMDEVHFNRQPTNANAYAAMGAEQAKAQRSLKSDTRFQMVGALDASDGRVSWRMRSHITVPVLRDFFYQLAAVYAHVETLYVTMDNWGPHAHPDLLAHLVEQPYADAFIRPSNWPTAPSITPPARRLPLVLLPLPTYASWLNPIEKLWGKCRRELTHLHPFADDLPAFKATLANFFNQFANGSLPLLHTVGLLPNP